MKTQKPSVLRIFLLAAFIALGLFLLKPDTPPRLEYIPVKNTTLIAHAGGGLPEGVYSNAREAFDLSTKNGFSLIEVDFNQTKNGEIVLMHDWNQRHFQYFSAFSWLPTGLTKLLPRRARTASNFMSRHMKKGLHQMDLPTLLAWMRAHPNVKIVTDVKGSNIGVMTTIKEKAPNLQNRFIVQIYDPQEYEPIIALGYQDIIFTTYRSSLRNTEIATFAKTHKLYALTVPAARVTTELCITMTNLNTPVFTHTINTLEGVLRFEKMGVSGFYTDYLTPSQQ